MCAEFEVQWQDIWNFDESGFSIEVEGTQKIVTRIKNRKIKIFHPDSACRQYVSACESIRTTGDTAPPMLIFEGKQYLEKWFSEDIGLHLDTIIGLNDSGYMNDELSMTYIKHWDRFTRDTRVGAWRVLLSDRYGAHVHYDFVDYCWNNHIIPYSLPPYSTHLMQPLDVTCFQPVKHYHRKAIDKAVRLDATKFPVIEFFSAFEYIREQSFKRETIISAFEQSGIYPLNAEKVVLESVRIDS